MIRSRIMPEPHPDIRGAIEAAVTPLREQLEHERRRAIVLSNKSRRCAASLLRRVLPSGSPRLKPPSYGIVSIRQTPITGKPSTGSRQRKSGLPLC